MPQEHMSNEFRQMVLQNKAEALLRVANDGLLLVKHSYFF